jgi:hypothetical protein
LVFFWLCVSVRPAAISLSTAVEFSVDLADRVECLAVVLNRMIVQAVEPVVP